MKGADEYYKLFPEAVQKGRLYLLPSSHARGRTFRIYVLPAGEKVVENGGINPPLNNDAVEVYGVIAGNPGWTEEYGWLHNGKWKKDFQVMIDERKRELTELSELSKEKLEKQNQADSKRVSDLLNSY